MRVKGITERQRTPRLGKQSKYERKTIDTKKAKIFVARLRYSGQRKDYLKFLKEKKNE